jgi:hypothetical protein
MSVPGPMEAKFVSADQYFMRALSNAGWCGTGWLPEPLP